MDGKSFPGLASFWKRMSSLLLVWGLPVRTAAFRPQAHRNHHHGRILQRTSLSSVPTPIQRVAIVGGGLAGLGTAYHLLDMASRTVGTGLDIVVFDKEEVGLGGASSVAGGLIHPLTPRGKLAHWGMEGLQATNRLVDAACQADPPNGGCIVLRTEIFRMATTGAQAQELRQVAPQLVHIGQWMESAELSRRLGMACAFGGLRLHNGCQVLHTPSYLRGLWAACQKFQSAAVSVQWKHQDLLHVPVFDDNSDYDAVLWAAGSGLFESNHSTMELSHLPIQLVRGQSMEIRLSTANKPPLPTEALLSGKYISPLPEPGMVLVGATHEFQQDPMSPTEVKQLLREKSESFGPHVWADGSLVERYTSGTRVQSQRGRYGRLPIVGRLEQSNHWIFTGLSSRGLLYHAVYGKLLAQAILERSENCLVSGFPGYDWWRPTNIT